MLMTDMEVKQLSSWLLKWDSGLIRLTQVHLQLSKKKRKMCLLLKVL